MYTFISTPQIKAIGHALANYELLKGQYELTIITLNQWMLKYPPSTHAEMDQRNRLLLTMQEFYNQTEKTINLLEETLSGIGVIMSSSPQQRAIDFIQDAQEVFAQDTNIWLALSEAQNRAYCHIFGFDYKKLAETINL